MQRNSRKSRKKEVQSVIVKEIRVYGYGKLENVVIQNLDNLTVLFGENEAGKSTIMSFIHSILFGFPTRQQTELLRYEPKFHSKYGGMLVVKLRDVGIVSVERVKGKATGDVTVTLPNGTIGGESLLTELLHGMDRNTFRSIYSFNIHDIQDVQQINNDDLNRFLFSSGAVGTDRLMRVETVLQKELDLLFKRRGQKPQLNVMLTDIREENSKLIKAKQQNDTYFILLQQQNELEKKQIHLKQHEMQLQENTWIVQEWQKMQPLLQEKTKIQTELEQIGELTFPVDGQNRIEQLQQLLLPIETQIAGKEERLQLLEKELAENRPERHILEREAEIVWVNETLSLYERLKHDESEQEKITAHLKDEIELLRDQFHLQIDEEKLLSLNTSMTVKDEVVSIDQELRQLQIKEQDIHDRLKEKQRSSALLEKEKSELEQHILSDTQRELLEAQAAASENHQANEREYKEIIDKLALLLKTQKKAQENERTLQKRNRLQTIFLYIIFLGVAVVSLINEQLFIGIAAFIGLISLLWIRRTNVQNPTNTTIEFEIDVCKKRQQVLADELSRGKDVNVSHIQTQLAKDKQLRERHTYVCLRLEQQRQDYESEMTLVDKLKKDSQLLKQACLHFANEWGVPSEVAEPHLLTVFEALDQLKKLSRKFEQAMEQLQAVTNKVIEIDERIVRLAKECGFHSETSIYQIAAQLKRLREHELEKQIAYKEKQVKHSELEDELKQLIAEKQRLKKKEATLFEEANVNNLEQFYAIGEKAMRRKQLANQLADIERVIDVATIEKARSIFVGLSASGEQELQRCFTQLEEVRIQIEETQTRLAEVKHEICLLEEGGTYAEILHRFKQKQVAFNEEGKKWARYAIAKSLLTQTMNKYKQEKLPKVLVKAGDYLAKLTDGEYSSILLSEDKGFMIERNDYVTFQPKELSQATAEQVYVALRLALAITLGKESHRYPIIIDDSFVNFDEKRINQTIHLLHEIATQHQVLFFTCHQHIATRFYTECVIALPKSIDGKVLEYQQ